MEWPVGDQNQIENVFYVQHIQSCMDPVISIDAAHLKSAYRGTIFIHLGLTGNEGAYIVAFGISGGNENY